MMFLFGENYSAAKHLDLGIALLRQNKFSEAILEFDKTLNLTPSDPYAHWNKATALLSLGDYRNGFAEHDWGWRLFDWRGFGPVGDDIDRLKILPVWHGEDISDQRLLVYHELGFGDAIMALRYLPELKRRAEHVTLIMSLALVDISKQFGVEVVDKLPDDLSDYDFRLPLFGVMSALDQTLENIPRDPYIWAEWKQRGWNKVGIAWSGRTQTGFSLDYFLSMFNRSGFELYSLQLMVLPPGHGVMNFKPVDFTDTVKMIERLDHIITVDTAVAHLAGAMGHPSTHLLLPFMRDWRWWHSAVWYPTIKTYHQENEDDWSMPFERLNASLRTKR